MSPLLLRRFRAERLLREEFDALRVRVLSSVRTRLRASGATLEEADLEAAYSLAWQGLYAAVLEGQEVGNPAGWLAVVAFRRAIEECRVGGRRRGPSLDHPTAEDDRLGDAALEPAVAPDLAAELDDRVRLRELFEGLRGHLSERELQAATLCYLQGLTRAEAALLMGISAERMRKLMEGEGPRRPGVAGKVGSLVEIISGGGWCDAQGSLMRGLAFGMLDPAGERYRLAQLHRAECPACRAYVLSLRGLATVLPPLPSLLHLAVGAGAAGAAGASGVAGASLGAGPATGTGAAGAATQSGPAIAGTLSASGAAGAGGAAGGGWLLAGGSVSAKLAIGCLLAITVGAGCVALSGGLPSGRPPVGRGNRPRAVRALARPPASGRLTATSTAPAAARVAAASSALTAAGRASREFGPEQALGGGARASTGSGGEGVTANAASSAFEQAAHAGSPAGRSDASRSAGEGSSASAATAGAGGATHAEREFGIG